MDSKTRNDVREFNRGYSDGKGGKDYDDGSDSLAAGLTLGIAGGPREGAKEYEEGYKAGRDDRKR